MSLPDLQNLAASNDWGAIWPELALGCLALLLLLLEIVLPKPAQERIPGVSLFGQAVILAVFLCGLHGGTAGREVFGGLLRLSPGGQFMRAFLMLASILACLIAKSGRSMPSMPRVEFSHIVLVVTAAMMLLSQSNHFVMLFVSLETVTVGFYVLVSYSKTSSLSLEAGLKYLILGALSSALLLLGIVLLYGVGGNLLLPGHTAYALHYGALAGFLAANPHNFLASLGIILVLAGMAFKIGGFPFQIWIPDVYQGAPTPVAALLAVASKGAGFAVLVVLVRTVFAPYAWLTVPALSLMTAATIIFGNLAALPQRNVKRLIGLSGVSHAGFLLLGVVAAARAPGLPAGPVYFYLLTYLLATFAVFGVMGLVAGPDDADQELSRFAGLMRGNPFLGGVLLVGLGSLAGIPPLAGFMGKFFIFVSAFQAGFYALLGLAIAGVVVSIYYYFGWIRAAFFDPPSPDGAAHAEAPTAGFCIKLALLLLALATVGIGFWQGPLGRLLFVQR